jgi:flagellar protein FlbD
LAARKKWCAAAITKERSVIKLTRLDGEVFVLNADLIRYIESRPDTFVTLTCGERMVVREPMDEVMERAIRYQQSKYLVPAPRTPALGRPLPSHGS